MIRMGAMSAPLHERLRLLASSLERQFLGKDEIIRLLLTMIPRQRRQALREEQPIYQVVSEGLSHATLHDLLSNIPLSDPPHL